MVNIVVDQITPSLGSTVLGIAVHLTIHEIQHYHDTIVSEETYLSSVYGFGNRT